MSHRRFTIAFFVLVAMGFPSAGLAEWQYTQWGMSVKDVVAASPTALKQLDEKVQEQSRAYVSDGRSAAMLAGWHIEGANKYVALFYFDLTSKELVSVNLDLKTMSQADQVLNELTKTYGAPSESSELMPSFYSRVWETNRDRIVFLRTPNTAKVNFFAK